jgi:hypothetical protein
LPDLRLVSERPAAEIKKLKASAALEHSLRALTVNLLRVVCGAGRPEQIAEHVEIFAKSFADYCDETREVPDPLLLRDMIVFAREPDISDNNRFEEGILENSICRHALQVVASTLIDQKINCDGALSDLRGAMQMLGIGAPQE